MAMIKCRECGAEISSRAEMCPHCGAKTRFGIQEGEKKEISMTQIILLIVSLIGTVLFFSGISTMMEDINNYNSWYSRGYNYQSPLTDHEVQVLMKVVIGGVLDFGGMIGYYRQKKNQ